MSFAATSMRGARLKARFAVKGIHSSSSDGGVAASGVAERDGAGRVDAVVIWIRPDVRVDDDLATIERRREYARGALARGGCVDERPDGGSGGGTASVEGDSESKAWPNSLGHVDTDR